MGFVSVVMPVFNGAEVLREQLGSLAEQDFNGSWELIIADNGSTDSSLEVIREFRSELPVRNIDASARSGDAAARNIGVAAAAGDVILFCDDDDAVGPLWIASHVECLANADISVGPYDLRSDMTNAETGTYVAVPMLGAYSFLPYGLSANMAMRRDAFESLGGFGETYAAASDVDLCWRAQLMGFTLRAAERAIVTKRKRNEAGRMWRQHYAFGRADVCLYSDFKRHGMTPSIPLALKTYGWLVLHSPNLLLRARRMHWIGIVAQRAGRVVGSLQTRQFFP